MKTVLRKKHYCDFCKKGGGRSDIIKAHEERCTLNPGRICGCCVMAGRKQPTMEELFAAARLDLEQFGKRMGLADEYMTITQADNLLNLTDSGLDGVGSCPACVLATIRQFKGGIYCIDWEFKKSMELWLGEFGEDRDPTRY